MKMEGDPHVTDWGVMRGQALDLITPQQVVGGLLLLNAEEKACIALQPRLEILDEQGDIMAPHPLLSQHDEPFPGAGEGQSRCATTKPWIGEEDGRLTLCTLNLAPPEYAHIYKPPVDDQLPPLIIAPPENAHLPLCPAPFSQEAEQNLEVDVPQRDSPPPDYLLDVRSLFVPDQDPCSDSLVSALDSHQVPEPINSLSADLDQMLQFTSDLAGEEPNDNDQMTPMESCLPLKTDRPSPVGPFLDPDVELLPLCNSNHSLPQLEPSLDQLPQSETLVHVQDSETEQLPQPESHLVAVIDQLPQLEFSKMSQFAPLMVPDRIQLLPSESDVEPDSKNLPLTESFVGTKINSCLDPDPEQLLQSESDLDPELLPNVKLNLGPVLEHLPQTEPNLLSVAKLLEPNLDPVPEQLPQTESNMDTDLKQLPQTDLNLDPEQLLYSQSNLDQDPEQFSLSRSIVDIKELSYPYLDPDTGQLPPSDSQVDHDPEQLPLTEPFGVTKYLSQSITHLDTDMVAHFEPYFCSKTDRLPQFKTESCLTSDHDLPCPYETSFGLCEDLGKRKLLPSPEISVTSDQLLHSGSCLEPNTGPLPLCDQLSNHENFPHSQASQGCDDDPLEYFCPKITHSESHLDTTELFETELDPPIEHSHHSLDLEIYIFNLSESFMAHDTEQSIEPLTSLAPTTDQFTQPIMFLDPSPADIDPSNVHLQELPPESDKVPSSDTLPFSKLSVDQIPNSGSNLDPDQDQLPWFELSMCADTTHLPFSMHSLNRGESSMAYEADELSLCDPFLAPDHFELSVSKSATEPLTLGDTNLEPPTCESSSDMDHKTMPGPLRSPSLENLQQSISFLTPVTEHLVQSESHLHHDTDRLTESCLDNDQLPRVENLFDSDTVPLPAPSGTLDNEQCPGLELDGSPESEPCLTMEDDMFFLSETFLAHTMDQIPVVDYFMTPETDQLPDGDQTEPCSPVDCDPLPQPDTCLIPDNDQLSEFPLSPHNDKLPQFESCSDPNINQLSKTEFCTPPENKSDHLDQPEPHLGTKDDQLTELEPCLGTSIDQLPQIESSLCQENEDLTQLESSLGLDDDYLSNACLDSDSDQLFNFEPPLCPSSGELSLAKSHLVPNSDLLPQHETYLSLESEELSQCESYSECPSAVPPIGHMTQLETFFHHDFNQFPLSECQQAPDMTHPNGFEPTSTPDQSHLVASPSCPNTDVLSLAHNLNLLCSIESPLIESPLTPDTDHFPLSESFVKPTLGTLTLSDPTMVPTTREMAFSEPLLVPSTDRFELLESSTTTHLLPLEPSVPHSAIHLPLFNQSAFSLSSESPTTPPISPSETPGTLTTNVPLCDSSITPDAPSSTNLSSRTSEEFQFPWDWTLHSVDLSEESLCGEPLQSSARQHDEPGDCFTIFCLDTPADSSHTTPEADLTLSDDILSLCDVFAHLQTGEIKHSQSDQSHISTNGQTDYHVEGDQFLESIFQDLESNSSSKPHTFENANPSPDYGFLDSKNDQLDFYCLDLLFEPARMQQELLSEPLLQPNLWKSTEGVVDSSTDPLGMCKNGSPPMEKSRTTNNSDGSLSHSDASFISSRFGQSRSQLFIDLDSLQSPGESTQVPVIVVTDPFELLSALDDHSDNILTKSPNALPLDMSPSAESELDAHLPVVEVPPCEMKELPEVKPDQLSLDCPESTELSLGDGPAPSPQPQSDSVLGTTFMPAGELQLTHTGSPFEGLKLRSRDSQDSTCPLLPFGEGDPLLAFTLDGDSPCAGDELARLRAVFDALDRDKDGFVKMEDFVQFATVYGAEQVKYLTGYLDPAGLGVINFRDFYRGISEIQNEDLDMQLYDMGYPSEEEPACSVDFDDLAAFEVTEVTDSAYVGSESAYSECETFTDEDTGGLAAHEDPETEGDGAGSRGHAPATPEGLELSLCDISGVTVTGQEEQFEDFGEGAEPDLFNSHEEEQESFTQTTNASQQLTSSGAPVSERQLLAPPPCSGLGGLYCSQCHKHINRLEDLSTRLRYLEMDSPDKRPSSRKEARRLHHSGLLGEDQGEQPLTNMSFDDTYLTDKVLYLEQRVSELERDAAMTGEQQNRLKQENLHLLHRAHALEEQLKDQEERSDEVQSEETRKHRDELRKMERDRGFRLSSLKARVQELESENTELRSQLPSAKATAQRLDEDKYKLLDQVEELQRQLKEHQEQNKKLGGKLSKEKHKQQLEKERCQEVIEELRRELEQTQLLRLEMEQRLGLGNSTALQEYNSRTRESELEQEVRRLKQEQRILKDQNEELNGQIINLSIQGAKNLFSTTFSDSLAAEISSVSRDELMEAIQKQEEINLRLQDYIDRIIVAIMETNPAILEVKMH